MNPTFSSPVLSERCTYRWEDLEKAAQGIYTDELKAEQARLRLESEATRTAPGFDAAAVNGFLNTPSAPTAPAAFVAEPMPEAAPAAKAPAGFTVPFRDESGFRVKEADARPAPRRAFFEPPRVTIPTADAAAMRSQTAQAVQAQAMPAPAAPAFMAACAPQAAAAPAPVAAPAADPALLECVAQETARAVTTSLLAQVDIIVAMALKSASAKIKSDVEAAVAAAAQQGVREALAKAQTTF